MKSAVIGLVITILVSKTPVDNAFFCQVPHQVASKYWTQSQPKKSSHTNMAQNQRRDVSLRPTAAVDNRRYRGESRRPQSDERRRLVERVLRSCRSDQPEGSLTVTEINHAISACGRMYRIDDSLEIFRALDKLGLRADLMTYNNIIWSVGNGGRFELAKNFFSELQKRKDLVPNVYTYGSLMHACAKVKGFRQALMYLDRMEESGISPNQIVFTSAMEACAEAGQYQEALAVMEKMSLLGLKPDITMINAAIKVCSLSGAMDEAENLASTLRDSRKMDLFTYHTLMMGHTKLARHQRVLTLYEEALESDAKLDGGVYSLAMLASLNSGMYQQVPRIADRARSESVPLTEAAYTILIQAYAEAGGTEQALQCLDQMVDEGLHPNEFTYATVLTACKNKPDVAVKLLERMKREGVVPNTVVLTSAIDALAREGNQYTDMAFQILKDMEANGPEPNIYTYNTVTRAFAEQGRLEEALSILDNIKKRGLSPDRFTFTMLLMACGRMGNSDDVSKVMGIMKQCGVTPDEISFGAAIDAHRRAGNSVLALDCLQDMYKNKLEPSAAHYNLVIRTLKAEGYVDKMFKMVMAISHKEGARINANTFELAIEAVLENEHWREALLLIQSMERLDFKPSLSIYVSLVELLERARQYKAVLALYRVMVRDGYDFYESQVLNGVFKRLVNVAAKGVDADLKSSAAAILRCVSLPPSLAMKSVRNSDVSISNVVHETERRAGKSSMSVGVGAATAFAVGKVSAASASAASAHELRSIEEVLKQESGEEKQVSVSSSADSLVGSVNSDEVIGDLIELSSSSSSSGSNSRVADGTPGTAATVR